MHSLTPLFDQLEQTPEGSFFNPWFQCDKLHDLSANAPEIRRRQLEVYLKERMKNGRYLCIAEALGYQGGHFTGIAMTSERILLGHHEKVHGILPDAPFRSIKPQRTSKIEVNPKGMSEPTATIMWKAIHKLKIDPREVVLWNALAWHPYNPKKGMLSNRTPTNSELKYGFPALEAFLKLFPGRTVIAVGKKATRCLTQLGIPYREVRHPANGGAPKFRRQMKELVKNGT